MQKKHGAFFCLFQDFIKLPRPANAPYLRPVGNNEDGPLSPCPKGAQWVHQYRVTYMDNGMDPLHFITGLNRAKMELFTTI
jgi:hypothetical protein